MSNVFEIHGLLDSKIFKKETRLNQFTSKNRAQSLIEKSLIADQADKCLFGVRKSAHIIVKFGLKTNRVHLALK